MNIQATAEQIELARLYGEVTRLREHHDRAVQCLTEAIQALEAHPLYEATADETEKAVVAEQSAKIEAIRAIKTEPKTKGGE